MSKLETKTHNFKIDGELFTITSALSKEDCKQMIKRNQALKKKKEEEKEQFQGVLNWKNFRRGVFVICVSPVVAIILGAALISWLGQWAFEGVE